MGNTCCTDSYQNGVSDQEIDATSFADSARRHGNQRIKQRKKQQQHSQSSHYGVPSPAFELVDRYSVKKSARKINVLILTPNSTKTAAGTSYLMQVVYEHLPLAQQLDMQLVRRRWFREYGPAFLAPIHLVTPKLLRLFKNSACIEVFSPTHLAWHQVYVSKYNNYLHAAREYYEGK